MVIKHTIVTIFFRFTFCIKNFFAEKLVSGIEVTRVQNVFQQKINGRKIASTYREKIIIFKSFFS